MTGGGGRRTETRRDEDLEDLETMIARDRMHRFRSRLAIGQIRVVY